MYSFQLVFPRFPKNPIPWSTKKKKRNEKSIPLNLVTCALCVLAFVFCIRCLFVRSFVVGFWFLVSGSWFLVYMDLFTKLFFQKSPQSEISFSSYNFILDMAEVLRDFQCKLCSKLLGSRAALQRHSKEVHSRNSTVVSCPRCQKLFQNRSNLKIHMLTHSGVRPFKCVFLKICYFLFMFFCLVTWYIWLR